MATKRPRRAWSIEQKIQGLAKTSTLTGDELADLLAREGVLPAEYEQWRFALSDEGRASVATMQRIRALEGNVTPRPGWWRCRWKTCATDASNGAHRTTAALATACAWASSTAKASAHRTARSRTLSCQACARVTVSRWRAPNVTDAPLPN